MRGWGLGQGYPSPCGSLGSGHEATDAYAHAEDGEFEVTADMLIHGEVDDEQTLEEEEALQCREEVEEEVDDLQKVRTVRG